MSRIAFHEGSILTTFAAAAGAADAAAFCCASGAVVHETSAASDIVAATSVFSFIGFSFLFLKYAYARPRRSPP